jgi:hypothetical protein
VCRGEMEILPDVDFYFAQEFAQKNGSVQTGCAE